MGLVKRHIEDMTYAILRKCNLKDTDRNYTRVFQWVMEQDFARLNEDELVEQYKKEKQNG